MTNQNARWLKLASALLAVMVVGLVVARVVQSRQSAQQAASSATASRPALMLTANDVLTLRTQRFSRQLALSGSIKASQSAWVKARVAAEIRSLSVREGDTVRAGQVIGALDTAEFDLRVRQAEQTASAAKAQLDIARRTLENNRALVAQGFISSTALEASVANELAAQANWNAAQAAADLARKARADAQLVAPIAGSIAQRLAAPGERVSVDARIVEIVDLRQLELEAALTPEDAAEIRVGQSATIAVDGIDGSVSARVARINPSAQTGSRAVVVYLSLAAHPALRQGFFARGQIELERINVVAAPVSAVRVDQAQPYVLLLQGGKVVQQRVGLGRRGQPEGARATEETWAELIGAPTTGSVILLGNTGSVREGTEARLAAGITPTAPMPQLRASAAEPASN
jgi:membrane fusion protein (multidrug efflux system)